MRKIKEIIRLKFGVGLSLRAIQQSLNVSYGTVSNYIRRAEQAGLGWPLPPDIDERTLGRLLFPNTGFPAVCFAGWGYTWVKIGCKYGGLLGQYWVQFNMTINVFIPESSIFFGANNG